jgi:hypothetical protein
LARGWRLTLVAAAMAVPTGAAACPAAATPNGPAAAANSGTTAPIQPLDSFDDLARWTVHPSDGVEAKTTADDGALRLDFDFRGHAGYVVLRRELALALPANYALRLAVRGRAPRENLELKLIDPSLENVWWVNRRGFAFPAEWTVLRSKRRDIEFAWGPAGGGTLRRVAAIELAVAAGEGGRGSVWFDDLALEPLPEEGPYRGVPRATATFEQPAGSAGFALDGDPATAWRPGKARAEWQVDFGEPREFGGLALDWGRERPADYRLELSLDGRDWRTVAAFERGGGATDWVRVPEGEARFIRLVLGPAAGGALHELRLLLLAAGKSANEFIAVVAKESPRGDYPRAFLGETAFWTVAGRDGGSEEGLLNEDGALELRRGGASIEPFVDAGGRLLTWADATSDVGLARGHLPLPWVHLSFTGGLRLEVAAVVPVEGFDGLLARYRLVNDGAVVRQARLLVAIRPFQVNPPWQFLNQPGGVSPIEGLVIEAPPDVIPSESEGSGRGDGAMQAPRRERLRATLPPDPSLTLGMTREGARAVIGGRQSLAVMPAPAASGALAFAEGSLVAHLRAGQLPERREVADPAGLAAGVFAWDFHLAPGEAGEVTLAAPWGGDADAGRSEAHLPAPQWAETSSAPTWTLPRVGAELVSALDFDAAWQRAADWWERRLGAVAFDLPPAAGDVAAVARTALGHILINRDGPAIQPGSRSYERSWIRDGALTSSALLRFGLADAARDFLVWYAPFQFPTGKVPCCVDRRGADPVPENDSPGELLFLVAEVYRFTGDRALVERLWPHVERTVGYIDELRAQRRTEAYRQPEKLAYFGLLPESISHEGYAAKPMHSYWDDFWALRGLKDAVFLAEALGRPEPARRWAVSRDEFAADLHASLRRTIERAGLDVLPGSVELADYDPTSSAIALAPGGELPRLPQPATRRTFERYLEEALARWRGRKEWAAYTPYELRNAGALVRLGMREEAWTLLSHLLADRRPPAWNQWPEVTFREPRAPRFLGDLPHTWVASEFLRALSDLFWYEGEPGELVLAGGIPMAWLQSGPVAVRGLRTPWGPLALSARLEDGAVTIRVSEGLTPPPGARLRVRSPLGERTREVLVDGRSVATGAGARQVVLEKPPAEVSFR